jgi:hypothetical protein
MKTTATSTLIETSITGRPMRDRLAAAAQRMYDAEGTLHTARQAQVDEWVTAAYDTLHTAIAEHTACLLALAA